MDSPNPQPRNCQLYLITPPDGAVVDFLPKLEAALGAVKKRVGALMLHLPNAEDDEILDAARQLQPVCAHHKIAFILHGRPDLAVEIGADGVHLAEGETRVKKARVEIGGDMILGVECGDSQDDAMRAGEEGADYVAFGMLGGAVASLEVLEWWQQYFVLPCLALGHVTLENCAPLVRAGADFIAVGAAVWDAPQGAAEAVKSFDQAIREALQTA